MIQMEELYTVEEVAALLKLKEETVTKLIRQKKLPGFKVTGGSWRVSEKDLKAYIEEQRRKYQQQN